MKIAFAGFGEVNTPIEIIENKCSKALESLSIKGAEIIPCFPIRDDYEEKDIQKAFETFDGKDFDVLVLCVAGWIPTHAVIKVCERYRHVPMVLWGLCGWIEDGRIVTTADQAGTSALRKTMQDLGYKFKYIYDIIGQPTKADKVLRFAKACSAFKESKNRTNGI